MPSSSPVPLRTPLAALHEALGARMVEFAGYSMPLRYPAGIIKEHLHTRTHASLFDVSHMGQARLSGAGAAAALESLMPADLIGLRPGRQRYGFFTNAQGGIRDDLMVANFGDFLVLIVNAACKREDYALLQERLTGACTLEILDDRALLALQGPAAARIMRARAPATAAMRFMDTARVTLAGADCFVSRSGYTGEDGFEISVPAAAAETLAGELLSEPEVAPAGLGARDSLRLEAGLCLYGHDLDATTSPVEASLSWALSRARRPGGARPGGYPGADVIFEQLAAGVARKRVALLPRSRVPVRAEALLEADGRDAGVVTSGGFGPTLAAPVAMGYVATAHADVGCELQATVRGERVPVSVAALPPVPHRYAPSSHQAR